MRIIAIANQKGGCGKTTTAINLAACLGKHQARVLLVDMDPQGHSTLGLGLASDTQTGLYEVFSREVSIDEVIIRDIATCVDIIPATISLLAIEHMESDWPREKEFALQLVHLEHLYDYVIIDCPPNLGLLSFSALLAAHEVIVPIEMSLFALDGMDRLIDTIDMLQERYNAEIPIRVLPTLVDSRTRIARRFLRTLWERFPDEILPVMIHYTVRLKEAVCEGKAVIDYAPGCTAASDYQRLADEIEKLSPRKEEEIWEEEEALYANKEADLVVRL